MILFQRAATRCSIKIAYSHGFNPRPKLSLPLPRSVGTESDEELLCLRIIPATEPLDTQQLMTKFQAQLPHGCRLISVEIAENKTSFQPRLATYILHLDEKYSTKSLKSTIDKVLASKNLNIQRQTNKKGNIRNLDVRPFLESITLAGRSIYVECKIELTGSIRVDEILKLLELDTENLTAPIRRTNIQWQKG